jgi:hypothetical protein
MRAQITGALCALIVAGAVTSSIAADARLPSCPAADSSSNSSSSTLIENACSWHTRTTSTGRISIQGKHEGQLPTLVLQNSSTLVAGSQPAAAGDPCAAPANESYAPQSPWLNSAAHAVWIHCMHLQRSFMGLAWSALGMNCACQRCVTCGSTVCAAKQPLNSHSSIRGIWGKTLP